MRVFEGMPNAISFSVKQIYVAYGYNNVTLTMQLGSF